MCAQRSVKILEYIKNLALEFQAGAFPVSVPEEVID